MTTDWLKIFEAAILLLDLAIKLAELVRQIWHLSQT